MPGMQRYRPRFWFIGHAHIDALWLWPWEETVKVIEETFDSVLRLMSKYPQLTYAQSSAAYYDAIERLRPEMFNEIKKRVNEGRWVIVGGSWVEFDANIPSGESLARQFLYGQRYFKEKFGRIAEVAWLPDSFGFPNTLPQIMIKSGIRYFYTKKILWNDMVLYPYYIFYWESPNGSKVLTYVGLGAFSEVEDYMLHYLLRRSIYLKIIHDIDEYMVVYGRGDHGGGPRETDIETIVRWSSRSDVEVRWSNVIDMFKKLEEYRIPTFKEELYLQFHRGIFTSEIRYKQINRKSEVLLDMAERFCTIASLLGYKYPREELERLWKKVLLYQFHDSISGSCIKEVYEAWDRDYVEVEERLRRIIEGALKTIESRIDTRGDKIPIVVFNPLTWNRNGLVEIDVDSGRYEIVDSNGNKVPVQIGENGRLIFFAEIPSLGYKVYWLREGEGEIDAIKGVTIEETDKDIKLENSRIRLVIDKKSGVAKELYVKEIDVNILGEEGIRLQIFEDIPTTGRRTLYGGIDPIYYEAAVYDAWETYIYQQLEGVRYSELKEAEEVKIIEKGPLRSTIAVKYRYRQEGRKDSIFIIYYSVIADHPFIEIRIAAEWHAAHRFAKLVIPFSFYSEYTVAGSPYGHVVRRNPYSPQATLYERAKYEVPFQYWIDYSSKDKEYGVSIVTGSCFAYDQVNNMIRISLLRSPRYPPKYGAEQEQWFRDGDIADQGIHDFNIVIYPHRGNWKKAHTANLAYEAIYPLIAIRTNNHPGSFPKEYSFLEIRPRSLLLTALKKAEEGDDIIMRIYDAIGSGGEVDIVTPLKIKKIAETNILEENPVEISGRPTIGSYEIKTLRISLEPGALSPR